MKRRLERERIDVPRYKPAVEHINDSCLSRQMDRLQTCRAHMKRNKARIGLADIKILGKKMDARTLGNSFQELRLDEIRSGEDCPRRASTYFGKPSGTVRIATQHPVRFRRRKYRLERSSAFGD